MPKRMQICHRATRASGAPSEKSCAPPAQSPATRIAQARPLAEHRQTRIDEGARGAATWRCSWAKVKGATLIRRWSSPICALHTTCAQSAARVTTRAVRAQSATRRARCTRSDMTVAALFIATLHRETTKTAAAAPRGFRRARAFSSMGRALADDSAKGCLGQQDAQDSDLSCGAPLAPQHRCMVVPAPTQRESSAPHHHHSPAGAHAPARGTVGSMLQWLARRMLHLRSTLTLHRWARAHPNAMKWWNSPSRIPYAWSRAAAVTLGFPLPSPNARLSPAHALPTSRPLAPTAVASKSGRSFSPSPATIMRSAGTPSRAAQCSAAEPLPAPAGTSRTYLHSRGAARQCRAAQGGAALRRTTPLGGRKASSKCWVFVFVLQARRTSSQRTPTGSRRT